MIFLKSVCVFFICHSHVWTELFFVMRFVVFWCHSVLFNGPSTPELLVFVCAFILKLIGPALGLILSGLVQRHGAQQRVSREGNLPGGGKVKRGENERGGRRNVEMRNESKRRYGRREWKCEGARQGMDESLRNPSCTSCAQLCAPTGGWTTKLS